MSSTADLSPDVRTAIGTFLTMCQKEARPFATSEALGAIKRIFEKLDVSDAQLIDAIIQEAAAAGFDVGQVRTRSDDPKPTTDAMNAAEEAAAPHAQTSRQIENDTSGTRRRAKQTSIRHEIL